MNPTSTQNEPVKPIADRLITLDALRGFALLGIYVSIIHSFTGTLFHGGKGDNGYEQLDRIIGLFEMVFINLRFIGIFSLLFGLGIAIQENNFLKRGASFGPYFARRMLILAVFGFINTTFFFWAEILLVYAVFGLVAFALSRTNHRLMLTVAAAVFLLYGPLFEVNVRDQMIESFQWFQDSYSLGRIHEIYLNGPLVEAIKVRWIQYIAIYSDNNFHMGVSLALILTGYVIGSKGWHLSFLQNLKRFQKPFALALVYTICFGVYLIARGDTFFDPRSHLPGYVGYVIFVTASLYTYVYLISAFCELAKGRNVLAKILANNGRLSLTGYMGGALAYSIIFYGYGFGQTMQHGTTNLALIALGCYAAFSVFSFLWLKRFPQGPMEWLYRKLSYPR